MLPPQRRGQIRSGGRCRQHRRRAGSPEMADDDALGVTQHVSQLAGGERDAAPVAVAEGLERGGQYRLGGLRLGISDEQEIAGGQLGQLGVL